MQGLIDPVELQDSVSAYVERVLLAVDENGLSRDQAFEELSRVYAAA